MRAVWLVLVAGFRRQWRSWVLLGLLIAVASGFVLASTAAGRRTDAAFPRYVASHGYDAIVYTVQPLPKGVPGVAQVTPVQMPFYDQPLCSCHRRISTGSFSVREVPPASLGRVAKLVAGRMPDPSSPVEALASFTLQRDYGVGLGTVITLPMAGASQRQAIFRALAGEGPPPKKATGPRMAMRVVGIVAAENEFSYGQGVTYTLYPGPGFAAATQGLARPHVLLRAAAPRAGRLRPVRGQDQPPGGGRGAGPRPARGHDHRLDPPAGGRLAGAGRAGRAGRRRGGRAGASPAGQRRERRPPGAVHSGPEPPAARRADHAADPDRGGGRRRRRNRGGHAAVAAGPAGRGEARRTRAGAVVRRRRAHSWARWRRWPW